MCSFLSFPFFCLSLSLFLSLSLLSLFPSFLPLSSFLFSPFSPFSTFRYVMCHTREELLRVANWPGVKGGARERLMDQLQGTVCMYILYNNDDM